VEERCLQIPVYVIAPGDLESAPQPPSDNCPSIIIDEDFAGTLNEVVGGWTIMLNLAATICLK
jgi:hypothetical protein